MKNKSVSLNNIFTILIIFFLIIINFTIQVNQDPISEIDLKFLPTTRMLDNQHTPTSDVAHNNLVPSSRARYIEHILYLDDPTVQLTIISGDAYDCSFNNDIRSGTPIATGDIDADGIEDLIIGCPYSEGFTENRWSAGQIMVIFGGNQTHPHTVYDQALKKPDEIDIVIHGADNGDLFGGSIACGDIDGDGFDDIVVGALLGDSRDNRRENAGEVYVIYGAVKTKFDPEIDLRSSPPDLMIQGPISGDRTGYSVALGNVVSDSKMDIIIGAKLADPGNRTNAGRVYIIAGDTRSNLGKNIDLLQVITHGRGLDDSDNNHNYQTTRNRPVKPIVKIEGVSPDDRAGFSVASGDVNGDGRDDVIIGARHAQYNASRDDAGVTYVIYGKQSFRRTINLTFEADVYIFGANANDNSGWSLAAGDINGDTYDDIMIGSAHADGPNNGQRDSGEVYIIYGSAALPQNLDMSNNEYDVILYGVDAWDNFGYSVAIGAVDDDKFGDFLIGVRGGNGEFNEKGDCGDTYLVMGNTSANLGDNIDPITESKSIIYGINIGDNSGRFVQFGDLDGDGLDDLIIGAPYADGPIESRDSAGEYYVIFSDPPPLYNEYLSLIDGDLDNKTVFTRYRDYTFRVNTSNILGYQDLKSVTFTLDPANKNISYRWSRVDKEFSMLQDPDELVECISTNANARHDGAYNYSVDFKLIFNWNFSTTSTIDCVVTTEGVLSYNDEDLFEDVFRVNNILNFKGELRIEGASQSALENNDWVSGSEMLTFSGLTVVYNGTAEYFPPISEYSLAIEDNTNIWSINYPGPGEEITATVRTPAASATYYYRFRILGIPPSCDNSIINVTFRVDNDPPAPPDEIICKADSFDELSEVKLDNDREIYLLWLPVIDLGSGIRGYYYDLIDFGGTDKGAWTEETSAKVTNVPEGLNSFYVWSEDNVGNIGFANSTDIFVDLTEITFENFTPSSDGWLTSKSVNCTIQVQDRGGFGADPKSIEYLDIHTRKWLIINVDPAVNQSYLNVSVTAELNEGKDSFVQFRAMDLAGNGPTESNKYYLKIDTTPVNFTGVLPNITEKQLTPNIRCYITIQDLDGSGVDLSTIQYSYSVNGVANFTKWSNNGLAMIANNSKPESASTWFIDLIFKRGSDNFIRWRASDLAGNGYTVSDPYPVLVNALPVIIIDGLDPNAVYDTLTDIEFNAERSYDPDDVLLDKNFVWTSNISGSIESGKVIRTRLPVGKHSITLSVFDGQNYARREFNITVVPPDAPKSSGKGMFGISKEADFLIIGLLIVIIVIIALFLVAYLREKKMRKKLEEKAFGPGVAYMSPYRPMVAGAKNVEQLPGGARVGGATEIFPLSASPYGVRTKPEVQPLPSIGGTATVSVGGPTPATTPQPTVAGRVGRDLPQLPPACIPVYPTIQMKPDLKLEIDTQKKIELLEKKMLLGEIPVELYNKLSKKYEEELKLKTEVEKKSSEKPSGLPKKIKRGFEAAPGFTPEELEFLRKIRKDKMDE